MSECIYKIPGFLSEMPENKIDQEIYEKWLRRKANALFLRDRKKKLDSAFTRAEYLKKIHEAVRQSQGKDAYTGEELDWHLISTYDNEKSKKEGIPYKASLGLLPTIDHVLRKNQKRISKSVHGVPMMLKNDLPMDAFLELCKKVLVGAGYSVEKR